MTKYVARHRVHVVRRRDYVGRHARPTQVAEPPQAAAVLGAELATPTPVSLFVPVTRIQPADAQALD